MKPGVAWSEEDWAACFTTGTAWGECAAIS